MSESIQPNVPFIWPEPRVSAGVVAPYASLPFDEVARSSVSIFGVASAIDRQAVEWMEAYLADSAGETRMRLVVSIQPTCRTTEADLLELVRLAERYAGRAAFRVYPERSLRDRSSNLLCFSARDASAVVVLGPAENLGLGPTSPSQANIVTSVSAPTLEACRKWFDYLWGVAGPLQPEIAASMPQLIIPEGDAEAARLWREYRTRCFAQPQGGAAQPKVSVDVKTGEVTLTDHNDRPVESPTAELGVPKLDGVADGIARVFEQGLLVAVDKTSRVPPLEAPVKPEWFGVDSFKQTGMVSSKTSFKVAPFDEATLKKVDRLRRASGDILPHYTYALADGMRWIPKAAIPLFEAALTEANDAAKKLLGVTVAMTSTRSCRPSETASAPMRNGCTRPTIRAARSRTPLLGTFWMSSRRGWARPAVRRSYPRWPTRPWPSVSVRTRRGHRLGDRPSSCSRGLRSFRGRR